MCDITKDSKVYIARRNFRIFKKVSLNNKSAVSPGNRDKLEGWKSYGTTLTYTKGKTVKSPSGPGIMGFTKPNYSERTILLVKKGTKYRKGYHQGEPMIAAESVLVCS